MIATVVVAALALLALAYVSAPLRRPGTDEQQEDPRRAELVALKHAALTAILDLESEHDAGKLSEGDLVQLRHEHEVEALRTLSALDALEPDAGAADDLEREIAEVKKRLSAAACPHCGAGRGTGSTCPRCGH